MVIHIYFDVYQISFLDVIRCPCFGLKVSLQAVDIFHYGVVRISKIFLDKVVKAK